MNTLFTKKLMNWYVIENKRIMPWKGEKNPYLIWISEIILQQTRVKQGLLYYNNFISKFPNVKSLAEATDEEVFKVWEGLGYYTRCRNLLLTARFIQKELFGIFPSAYQEILSLKGIGPYTAAAISSFAYGLPHAVIDGNVFRVLSRVFGDGTPIDSIEGRKHFTRLANNLLDSKDPAGYNQAIMDFGATICKPLAPECEKCFLQQHCVAYKKGIVNQLPVKGKRLIIKKRWFTYLILRFDNKIFIKKREGKDIWEGLNEFLLFETLKQLDWTAKETGKWLKKHLGVAKYQLHVTSKIYTQRLTHQLLQGMFIIIELKERPEFLKDFKLVNEEEFALLSFPRIINHFLSDQPPGTIFSGSVQKANPNG